MLYFSNTLAAQRLISQASNDSTFLPPFFFLAFNLLVNSTWENHETSQTAQLPIPALNYMHFFRLSHRMMEFHHGICTQVCLYNVLSFSATTTIEFSSEGWRDGWKITSACCSCRPPGFNSHCPPMTSSSSRVSGFFRCCTHSPQTYATPHTHKIKK